MDGEAIAISLTLLLKSMGIKTCTDNISQLKCSRLSFLNIFLVPYAFTDCNLGVGKFDVFASIMIIFVSIFYQA